MKEKIERIKTSLQIDEGIDLHIVSWTIQRVGWVLILVMLTLAMLGLFGNGVLSERSIRAGDMSMRYERFARFQNNTAIEVTASAPKGGLTISFSRDFASAFKVEEINPEPAGQRIERGLTVYLFRTTGSGRVTFFVSPRRRGRVEYDVRIDGAEFHPETLIYP
jgi:hypothetical protein